MQQYEIVFEETGNGFSAYVPALPGCVAAAETREETDQLIREAIDLHLELLYAQHNLSYQPVTQGFASTEALPLVDASAHQIVFGWSDNSHLVNA